MASRTKEQAAPSAQIWRTYSLECWRAPQIVGASASDGLSARAEKVSGSTERIINSNLAQTIMNSPHKNGPKFPWRSEQKPPYFHLDVRKLSRNVQSAIAGIQKNSLTPIEIAYPSFATSVGLAVQPYLKISPLPGYSFHVSQYYLLVAESGDGKSPAVRSALAPHIAHDAHLRSQYEQALARFMAQQQIHKEKLKGIKSKIRKNHDDPDLTKKLEEEFLALEAEKPVPPRNRSLIMNDVTPEALLYALREPDSSVAILTDEAGNLMESRLFSNFSTLNSLWSGGIPQVIDRKTSASFSISGAHVTMFASVQFGPFRRYCESRGALARDSGLFARCWISSASVHHRQPLVLSKHQDNGQLELDSFYVRINELRERAAIPGYKRELVLSPAAGQLWLRRFNELQLLIQPGGKYYDIRDFIKKHMENVTRHAAMLHAFEYDHSDEVSEETLEQALLVGDWYIQHFQEMMVPKPGPPQEMLDAELLIDWLYEFCHTEGHDRIAKSRLEGFGPSSLRRLSRLNPALMFLERYNLIRFEEYMHIGARNPTRYIVVISSEQYQSRRYVAGLNNLKRHP